MGRRWWWGWWQGKERKTCFFLILGKCGFGIVKKRVCVYIERKCMMWWDDKVGWWELGFGKKWWENHSMISLPSRITERGHCLLIICKNSRSYVYSLHVWSVQTTQTITCRKQSCRELRVFFFINKVLVPSEHGVIFKEDLITHPVLLSSSVN